MGTEYRSLSNCYAWKLRSRDSSLAISPVAKGSQHTPSTPTHPSFAILPCGTLATLRFAPVARSKGSLLMPRFGHVGWWSRSNGTDSKLALRQPGRGRWWMAPLPLSALVRPGAIASRRSARRSGEDCESFAFAFLPSVFSCHPDALANNDDRAGCQEWSQSYPSRVIKVEEHATVALRRTAREPRGKSARFARRTNSRHRTCQRPCSPFHQQVTTRSRRRLQKTRAIKQGGTFEEIRDRRGGGFADTPRHSIFVCGHRAREAPPEDTTKSRSDNRGLRCVGTWKGPTESNAT